MELDGGRGVTRNGDNRFSHRGRGLMLLGFIWVCVGVSVLLGGGEVSGPLSVAPGWVRSLLWLISGAVAIFAALKGAAHPKTTWAFQALLIPAALRAISHALSFAAALFSSYGDIDAWVAGLAWTFVTVFVLHEASTPVVPPVILKGDLTNE